MTTNIIALRERAKRMGFKIYQSPYGYKLIDVRSNHREVRTDMIIEEIAAWLDKEAAGLWYEIDEDGKERRIG